MLLTAFFSFALYIAVLVLIVGTAVRIVAYVRTPVPLVIPTTPAPTTRAGVLARLFRETVFFESLFKGSKWTWLFGWVFHFGMMLVLLEHLRYIMEPVPRWIASIQWMGLYAGIAMCLGLAGLSLRRMVVDRVRYISAPSDHLMLLLLIGIAASGIAIKTRWHTDIVGLKTFVRGLIQFDWQPLPADPLLLLHLSLVILLMLVFPFSKLLHAPGLFFSPTRNMRDSPREHRHVPRWAPDDSHPPARTTQERN